MQFVDGMPFGIYIIDSNRNIIFWNQIAQQISGYRAQDAVGRLCSDEMLSHCSASGDSLCSKESCPMSQSLQDGISRRAVLFLRHKEGHRVRVLARTVPVRDEEGKVIAVGQVFQLESFVAGLLWGEPDMSNRGEADLSAPDHTEKQLWLHWHHEHNQLAAFLISIEKLHEMGIHRGATMVQTILHTVAKTVISALWMPHYLGTWTNQRFILLVPRCDPACREQILTELQAATGSCSVSWWGDRIVPTVRIKVVAADGFDSPEAMLSSLDPTWGGARPIPGDS